MDTDLVVRAQHGDKEAYALLAAEIADRYLAVSRRILRDMNLAEDATQQALLAIWQNLPDDRTQQTGMRGDLGCSRVSTDDARALARIFDDAGIPREQPEPRAIWLRYTFQDPGVPGNRVWIQYGPILPHGEAIWLGPG